MAYLSATGNGRYQLISVDDLNRLNEDFSRPLVASLSVHSQWSDALKSSLTVSYQGDYTRAVDTGSWYFAERDQLCTQCEDVELAYPVYQDAKRPARTMVSANVQYQLELMARPLTLSVEIDNVLNQRTYSVAEGQQGLESGRSFWLGAEYRW